MRGVLSTLFVSTAYQRRTCGLTRVSTANVVRTSYMYIRLLWCMCFVFCGVPRVSEMPIWNWGSFRATFTVTSVFVKDISRT